MKRNLLIVLMLSVVGCTQAGPPDSASRGEVQRRGMAGPLDGLTWGALEIEPGSLLHDDGSSLWSVGQDGERTLVWDHPEVVVTGLGVDGGGRRVALGVQQALSSGRGWRNFLYVLEPDGSVQLIDAFRGHESFADPVFLRPTDPEGEAHLHWLRLGDGVGELGRYESQVYVEQEGSPTEIEIPLRAQEGMYALHGQGGNSVFSFSVFRARDTPARFEVFTNRDAWEPIERRSLTRWRAYIPQANTDSALGVAWLTPGSYVIPVVKGHSVIKGHDAYSLRLRWYRVGCEHFGSKEFYQGDTLDPGLEFTSPAWRILPGGPDSVLLIGREEAERAHQEWLDNSEIEVPFTRVSVADGSLETTSINWKPGPWAYVYPDEPVLSGAASRSECREHEWVWP